MYRKVAVAKPSATAAALCAVDDLMRFQSATALTPQASKVSMTKEVCQTHRWQSHDPPTALLLMVFKNSWADMLFAMVSTYVSRSQPLRSSNLFAV